MSYTEKQTYDMITNYNHIEDILGYSCYPELFVFLLQHIGYNIETQDINTRSENKKNNKGFCLPPDYEINYNQYKHHEDINWIVYNKKTGNASTQEKYIVDCYCFYSSFIKYYLTITENDITKWINDVKKNLKKKQEI